MEAAGRHPEEGAVPIPNRKDRGLLEVARRQLARGDLEEAARLARDLLERAPRSVGPHLVLGEALGRLAAEDGGDLDLELRAEAELLAAVRLGPDQPDAHAALGRFHESDGHLEAALDSYQRALRLSARHLPALLGAARVATELGLERSAEQHLAALRAGPGLPTDALLWEARCCLTLARAGDQDEDSRAVFLNRALRAFQDLGQRLPGDPRGPAGAAHCLFLLFALRGGALEENEVDRLRALYLEGARLAPRDPLPRYNLGRVLESKLVNQAEAAIDSYRAALGRDPDHLPSLLNLARLEWNRDRRAARSLYERALRLTVNHEEKEEIRALLGSAPAGK